LERCGYPIVLKPLAGVGSKNTVRVTNDEELYSALNILLPSAANPIQAEAFIQGEEFTMEAVSIEGKVVWQSSTYYLPGPLKVIENPWIQYCVLLPREPFPPHAARFCEQNKEALDVLGIETGLSHMEWFQEEGGRQMVSEVGARPPGVNIMPMMSIAYEVPIWNKWAELMVHHRWEMPERKYAVATAFLRAQGRGGTISDISGLEELRSSLSPFIAASSLPRVGQPRSQHYEGDGWIILKHPETEVLVQALKKLLSTIQIRS
jgi:biotin carboxylase